MAVEAHFGQGVQPIADQEDLVLGQERRVCAEGAAILPVALGDPLDVLLIVRCERVGDAAQGQQIGVDAAGHLSGQPFVGSGLAELP